MGRWAWAVTVVLGAAVLVAVVIWVYSSTAEVGDAPDPGSSASADTPRRPDNALPLTVLHVYDGDTIQAAVQEPNDVVAASDPIRIRLIGVDTPEGTPTPECWADEARSHLAELLPEGSTVWAAPDREIRDRYDRYLFNLWSDAGVFINLELVEAGDAEAIRVRPNVAHFELLAAAQAEAEASGAGRWGACG